MTMHLKDQIFLEEDQQVKYPAFLAVKLLLGVTAQMSNQKWVMKLQTDPHYLSKWLRSSVTSSKQQRMTLVISWRMKLK